MKRMHHGGQIEYAVFLLLRKHVVQRPRLLPAVHNTERLMLAKEALRQCIVRYHTVALVATRDIVFARSARLVAISRTS